MKKEMNYIEEYQWDRLVFEKEEKTPPTNEQREYFDLVKLLVETRESQYKRRKNKQKWDNFIDILYPALCNIAEIQGGCVKMNTCEDTCYAGLIYIGNNLMLDIDRVQGLTDFNAILSAADSFSISQRGEYFEMHFTFELYDKIKIADLSGHIMEIEKRLKEIRCSNL